MSTPFAARLHAAQRRLDSAVCVGIDPRFEMLPDEFRAGCSDSPAARAAAIGDWAVAMIDVVAPLVPIVKPQAAFFEVYGADGWTALARTVARAKERGLLVLLDAKRGDIGSTAEAYATALLDDSGLGVDALTVNAYLGRDTLAPFVQRVRRDGKGIYVLVKTSNPGSNDVQNRVLDDGTQVHEIVADMVAAAGAECPADPDGWASVGAVVGATYPRELATLRERMPHTPLLVPGYGAQGGSAADCAAAFGAGGLGAVVNSSRGISFAFRKGDHAERFGDAAWRESVTAAVGDMTDALRGATAAANAG